MENLMSRYRNVTILVAILFVQVLGLAVQVKRRSGADESTRVIRLWTVSAITPFEKAIVWCQSGLGGLWSNYVYLRGVRQENRDLKFEIERLRLEQVRLSDDAQQARRLQALLGFKEQYIAKTVAAQVIGSSGSEQSRSIFIDKGTDSGVQKDMAVITADGLVGKVLLASSSSAQVLLINDQSSGVGVILDKSRLQGVIKGTAAGEVILEKVMTDEQVTPGERIVTSGGDQIFPKGITVGTVMKVSPGADLFLNIRVKPSANLSRLEEVLVITKKEERAPSTGEANSMRAVDILTRRLPSVPDNPTPDANPSSEATTAKPPAETPGPPSEALAGQEAVKPALRQPAPATRKALPGTAKPASSAPAPPEPGVAQPGTSPRGTSPTRTSEDKPH
jgi:rod shape-determining protein MreC